MVSYDIPGDSLPTKSARKPRLLTFCDCRLPVFDRLLFFVSAQFGHIVLTTTFGIMDHEEARRKHTGGKILGFFY